MTAFFVVATALVEEERLAAATAADIESGGGLIRPVVPAGRYRAARGSVS
ncbi:hypothetical protein M8J71_04665 [Pseudarthrobacter sp. R1]|nr:hypothetical protein [Pseudarthrobacter sp. R1]MCQ6269777.1 hypothetical protein [Pseudarthrobacter sp. R1]